MRLPGEWGALLLGLLVVDTIQRVLEFVMFVCPSVRLRDGDDVAAS